MTENTVSKEFFEARYRNDSDPWQFETNPYELTRYEEVIRALGHRRFHRAFEPGCSIGILTERLAERCDQVIAHDISTTAARKAQERCARFPGATVYSGSLPKDIPPGSFDLIILSEIGYYFEPRVLSQLADALRSRLIRGGVLLAEHWLGHSPDHILSGDQVHEILNSTGGLTRLTSQRFEGFRLDTWEPA